MAAPVDRAQAVRVLAEELRAQIGQVDRVVAACRDGADRLGEGPPGDLELAGAAGLLHNFYTGVERALLRIAPDLNGGVPPGPQWHRRLLEQMVLDVPRVRPAVLRAETARRLDEYRGFRHVFRNLYFFDLRWERCRELLRGATPAWVETRSDLVAFVAFLDRLGAESESPHQ